LQESGDEMKTTLWLAALALCCGVLGAQSGPEIELQCPPGTAIASGSNDTNWPPLFLQSQWFARTMRVVNTGTATLTLGSSFTVTHQLQHADGHVGPNLEDHTGAGRVDVL
jgi:hypothetical protein